MFNLRLLFVSLVWGMNFSLIKTALSDFGPMSFTLLRFALASLSLFAALVIMRVPLRVSREDRLPLIGLGLSGIALYSIFFMEGLTRTSASNSALLISLSPLFAALIQAMGRKERIGKLAIAGLVLAAAGVVLIIRDRPGDLAFGADRLKGDLLTLCASALWAFYTLSARPILARHHPMKVTAYAMGIGCILLLPYGAGELTAQDWAPIAARSWASLAFSAFIAGGAAYSLWYDGVKQLGATRTAVYHFLVPVVAVAFAALLFGERVTLFQLLGGAAILSGVALVQRKRQESTKQGA